MSPVGQVPSVGDTRLRGLLDTRAAVSAVLVRSDDEAGLLHQMCQAIVGVGGYRLAWYARVAQQEPLQLECPARAGHDEGYIDACVLQRTTEILEVDPSTLAIDSGEVVAIADMAHDERFEHWRDFARQRDYRGVIALPVRVDGDIDGALLVYSDQPGIFDDAARQVLEDLVDQLGFGIARHRESGRLLDALRERALLSSVIDQAVEAIVVTDTQPVIVYANPAALDSYGYTLEEVKGRDPSMFTAGLPHQSAARQLWKTVRAGEPWQGVLTTRRKGGELFEEEVMVSPVFGENGDVVAFAWVMLDLSEQRALQARVDEAGRDRQVVKQIVGLFDRPGDFESTVVEFCQAATLLDGVDFACLVILIEGDVLVPFGPLPGPLKMWRSGTPVEVRDLSQVAARLEAGSWLLDMSQPPVDPLDKRLRPVVQGSDVTAVAAAPIRHHGELVGGLWFLGEGESGRRLMTKQAVIEELASSASGLFGAQAAERAQIHRTRGEIEALLHPGEVTMVYQPLMDLASDKIYGYEALARFSRGRRPDMIFDAAVRVGLGTELEVACARAAIEGARGLPPDLLLSLNFSPSVLLQPETLDLIRGVKRPLVVEITEHVAVESYEAIRVALAPFDNVRLSVDDAGAGYATLQHVLELRPEIIKLDRSLVQQVDQDLARQAMVAAMTHYSAATEALLIAEGVETAEEVATLRRLGVPIGQGFHLGRPGPLP